jgi:hypothetical protein
VTALVVVNVSRARGNGESKARLDIFPGGSTPAVYPADTGFWIGYGFAPDREDAPDDQQLDDATRFELDVDGHRVEMHTNLRHANDVAVRKTDYADFPAGLAAGWHDFVGRWYDCGKLILSRRAAIEFVER